VAAGYTRGMDYRFALVLVSFMGLAACASDPLKDVEKLSDVKLAEEAPVAEIAAAPEPMAMETGGFLRGLFRKGVALEAVPEEAVAAVAVPAVEEAPPKKGLFGFLKAKAEAAPVEEAPVGETPVDETVEVAALAEPEAPAKAGVFGFLKAKPKTEAKAAPVLMKEAASEDVPQGVVMPVGKVGRLCGVSERDLGKAVESYPERSARYRLYDTVPDSAVARTMFVSGFADGCLRQFTGALAMFGSAELYEALRYGPVGKTLPKGETDAAYEGVKAKVCGVAAGKPCGRGLAKLERETVFVNVYQTLGDNSSWGTLLLHDGAVVAADLKSR
jgi:hypothetical protein